MKQIIFFLVLFLLAVSGCGTSRRTVDAASHATGETETPVAQESPAIAQAVNYHDPTTWLLGYFNPAGLRQSPHATWFISGQDEYMPVSGVLNQLLDISHDALTIKIVMGTWCPDSRREVPRFMKILELWKFPSGQGYISSVSMIDKAGSPVGEFDLAEHSRECLLSLFYKNNIEAGRIIEVPKTSLEQDMVNILSGNEK